MLIRTIEDCPDILACPACRAPLTVQSDEARCTSSACPHSRHGFDRATDKWVLVDFGASILDRDQVLASGGASLVSRSGWREWLTRAVNGTNAIAPRIARHMLDQLARRKEEGRNARLLIVGGGAVGSGAESLYAHPDVDVLSFDIYASDHVSFIADGHAMPLADRSVDAVWIQAVLEHVADPAEVVAEMTRVLKEDGLVFADTPFLWPVHEGAYDFTRWTVSGHRWLFRDYDVLASGASSGPGTASLLALRYLCAALTRSTKLGQLLTLPFLWLRLLDRFCEPRKALDGAAGIYFYGRKSGRRLGHAGLVRFYDEQIALEEESRAGRLPS